MTVEEFLKDKQIPEMEWVVFSKIIDKAYRLPELL